MASWILRETDALIASMENFDDQVAIDSNEKSYITTGSFYQTQNTKIGINVNNKKQKKKNIDKISM